MAKSNFDILKKEFDKDLDVIAKAREEESKKEIDLEPNFNKRIPGLKILMWIGFGYLTYNVYSYTPLKENINKLFEEEFF